MKGSYVAQFEDTIFYTNVDYMNNLMSSINGKNPKSGDNDEEEPKLMEKPESFLIGNTEQHYFAVLLDVLFYKYI